MDARRGALIACLLALVACARPSTCGAPAGGSAAAERGLRRGTETRRAMEVLGLRATSDPHTSQVFLLGYPNLGLREIAGRDAPFTADPSGLHRTYAEDGDGDPGTCNGDLRFQLDGTHSPLTGGALSRDLDALLALTNPSDVYTHASFDGHPDHAEVAAEVERALARSGLPAALHTTLVHPPGSGDCMDESAREWPNPRDPGNDPFARLTPQLDIAPPPLPACGSGPREASWGEHGPPDELIEVPGAMQDPDPAHNLKWLVLSRYESQIDCGRDAQGRHHPSCGYVRAFVKRREFFWTRRPASEHANGAGSRILVIGAHPDDEALAAAGVIAHARTAARPVFVAVVTNGDSTLR